MINDNTWNTIELLIKDANFFGGFQRKLDNFALSDTTEEEQNATIKDAYIFMMHVVDYYATVKMIDMEGDLARLCRENPTKAERLSASMSKSALVLKENYQRLLRKGTIYSEGIALFPFIYSMKIQQSFIPDSGKDIIQSEPFPINTPLSELELISANDDKDILVNKCKNALEMDFTESSIKEFIDKLFDWSDKITDYLNRMGEYKTVARIDDGKLRELYDFCIENGVISSCKPDHFARALRNEEPPKFHLYNRDTFYAILYSIYELLGKLGTRDAWSNEIQEAFEIDRTSYSSLVSRIKSGKLSRLLAERYERIKEILKI